ncbi:MAG: bifunctional folylpolyglutamate synthase/dihydrofolate synthase [Oscillospiraceae bacterium]|nr:bifunctional folylpolyglutamate synthase/dihydrofolate synthase [Oscillospiraceae bacterium]
MNFNEAMNYINNFSHSGKKVVDLSRISALLDAVGNPQSRLKFVHIAGTNGKGSVLEYCSNAFIEAGFKTGQFTSPYILTYCDRIRINGKNIPQEKVAEICEKVKKAVSDDSYSQFEITFAIALLYFLEEKCDIVFLETGIGGTLDATNIIENPLACVVTSVSLDHMAILGNTVEEIATHKLGITKKNTSLVLSCNNTESVKKLADETALQKQARLVIPDCQYLEILENSIYSTVFRYKNVKYSLKMYGEHQIINALTAIETLEILKEYFNISQENIVKSLSESFVRSRIEVSGENPMVITDGGHNEAGIDSLVNILKSSEIDNVTAIFGMVEGKAVDYAVEKLSDVLSKVYCVDGYIDNNIPAKILAEKFTDSGVDSEYCDYRNVWNTAFEYAVKNDTPLLICGSLYLASAVKKERSI